MRSNELELADIFRQYGPAYRKLNPLPKHYVKVMNLITSCRTSSMGGHLEKCNECGYERNSYNSCRNRHCPKCQYTAKEKWLVKRKEELLPVPYYHVVFTIPDLLNNIALTNKEVMYDILFKSASQTLLVLGKDQRHLGADIGLIAILHTWGQNLAYHPHLHCVVPGGGLSLDKSKWVCSKKARYNNFFIHVNIISDLFKKKFLSYFRKAYKNGELIFTESIEEFSSPEEFLILMNKLYKKKWITYCKRPFGGPEQVLEYLGRYTHRVAISNSRIKRMEDGKVVFEWKDYRDGSKKEMALAPMEFIRRFLLHIFPEGFFKIRYYGLLSSRNKKKSLLLCREILKRKEKEGLKEKSESFCNNEIEIESENYKRCPICKKGIMFTKSINIRAA